MRRQRTARDLRESFGGRREPTVRHHRSRGAVATGARHRSGRRAARGNAPRNPDPRVLDVRERRPFVGGLRRRGRERPQHRDARTHENRRLQPALPAAARTRCWWQGSRHDDVGGSREVLRRAPRLPDRRCAGQLGRPRSRQRGRGFQRDRPQPRRALLSALAHPGPTGGERARRTSLPAASSPGSSAERTRQKASGRRRRESRQSSRACSASRSTVWRGR